MKKCSCSGEMLSVFAMGTLAGAARGQRPGTPHQPRLEGENRNGFNCRNRFPKEGRWQSLLIVVI
jgi:hypothetical protein